MKQTILTSLDMAARISVLVLALVLAAFIAVAGARTAHAASLKQDVVLDQGALTVGHLFDNAGRNAAYILGPGPNAGETLTLNASSLLRIAMALDLDWRPASPTDKITVTRAATIIPTSDIESALEEKLSEHGLTGNFSAYINGTNHDIILPVDQAATVEIDEMRYDPRTSTFTATVYAPSRDKSTVKLPVSGQVRQMISVPVLKAALRNGDLIGMNDLDFIEMYVKDIGSDVITDAQKLINMTPRRVAIAGQPVRAMDIQRPELVSRGKNVTIIFKTGPMMLTATGRALQNGANGDLVRVTNLASNIQVDAVVTGSHEVTVTE